MPPRGLAMDHSSSRVNFCMEGRESGRPVKEEKAGTWENNWNDLKSFPLQKRFHRSQLITRVPWMERGGRKQARSLALDGTSSTPHCSPRNESLNLLTLHSLLCSTRWKTVTGLLLTTCNQTAGYIIVASYTEDVKLNPAEFLTYSLTGWQSFLFIT